MKPVGVDLVNDRFTQNSGRPQTWTFNPWKSDLNHVRVSNIMAGSSYCLDVVNDTNKSNVQMIKSGNYSGQAWHSNTPEDMELK